MPDPRRKSPKAKYTEDRMIPGSFEGETVTRRRFMVGSANLAGGVAAAAFVLPALGFAVGPVFERQPTRWEDVGSVFQFPDDTYVPVNASVEIGVGETGKTTVYMRKHNPQLDGPVKDEYDRFMAISTRCAHLGCPVRFVEAAERFICPCHGGVYDFAGKVSGGPPVRPLDRFYTRVANGRVFIGPRYSVNSELQRFTPRDPGEPLDGLGQYAYPPRFSVPKVPNSNTQTW